MLLSRFSGGGLLALSPPGKAAVQLSKPTGHTNLTQLLFSRPSLHICSASYEGYDDAPQRSSHYNQQGYSGDRGSYGGGGGIGYGGGGGRGYGQRPRQDRGGPASGPRMYTDGGAKGSGGEMKGGRQWGMTYEQQQMYREVRDAVNACSSWRELASVVEAKSSIMDSENISNVMELLTWDGRPKDPEECAAFDSFLSALMGWCLALMPTFQPRQTVRVISSMGQLELYSEELVSKLVDKVIKQLSGFKSVDYRQIMEAFIKLGVTPDARFVAEFCTQTVPIVPSWFHDTLGNTLALFVRTSAVPTPEWMQAAAEAYANRARYFEREGFVDLLVLMGTTAKEKRWQPSEELLHRILEGSKELITPLSPQLRFGNANSNRGSSGSDQAEGGLRGNWSKPYFKRTVHVSDYTRMLWALSNFDARPTMEWYATFYASLAQQQRYWTPENLGVQALYLSRYLQAPVTLDMAQRLQNYLTNPGQVGLLGADGAAAVMYLLAISGVKPSEKWLDDVVIEMKKMLPQCSVLGLEMVYNGLPLLGSGYRLNEMLVDAGNRYNALVAAEQPAGEEQQPETAAAQ